MFKNQWGKTINKYSIVCTKCNSVKHLTGIKELNRYVMKH
jgi:hypothetical protein